MERGTKDRLKKLIPPGIIGSYHQLRLWSIDLKFSYYRATLKGNQFECAVCDQQFSRFLPDGYPIPVLDKLQVIGAGERDNCVCPNCRSKDRDRWLFLFLSQETGFFKNKKKLLHLAPERCLRNVFGRLANLDYINADLNPDHADVQMDITDIQYPDNHFDVILCNHVLEHIPDDGKAMRELLRVLKPGGWAILQVPISLKLSETYEDFSVTTPAEKERHFGQFDHVRIYGQDYVGRLKNAGFDVRIYDPVSVLGQQVLKKQSLNPKEKLYLCYKEMSQN